MNIKRAKQEIINTIRAYLEKDAQGEYLIPAIRQRPILLMGPPGIGKTQIMEQIAGECDLALVAYTITHHTRQSAIGLPFIVEKVYDGQKRSVTEYTMSEIIASVYDRMEASGKQEGILFIDEINCVSETLAPTMLQFLQGKTFGNQAVPKGWIIVAAGNPPEYNRSVRDFDVVTLDRVKVIDVEADFEVWKEYAWKAGIHGSILSYLEIRRDQFYRMETSVDGKRFVTARGWQDLSELICAYERLGIGVDREVTGQYLQHPATAKDFANYLELYYRYQKDYQVDEILSGTIRPAILSRLKFAPFDERVEVVGLLLAKLSQYFREADETDRYTDALFAALKEYRRRAAALGAAGAESTASQERDKASLPGSGSALLAAIRQEKERTMEERVHAGQNEKEVRREGRRLLATLEAFEALLKAHEAQLAEKEQLAEMAETKEMTETTVAGGALSSFSILQEAFEKETAAREQVMENTMQKLEYAFDFMEAAFGESQEMVLFITELSVNPYAAAFLRENDCPRYYMYNKNLLFEDQDARIRAQLDEIRDLQIT